MNHLITTLAGTGMIISGTYFLIKGMLPERIVGAIGIAGGVIVILTN